MQRTYPVSLVLDGQNILVVGGGAVATRKVTGLLPYRVSITVVSPCLTDALQDAVRSGACTWKRKCYDSADLDGMDLVFVATDDDQVNTRAYADAQRNHLMINVADKPHLCTFFLPSVYRNGKLSVAVSTEGSSPLTARLLRDQVASLVPDCFEAYLDLLDSWRPRAIATLPTDKDRYRFWQQATDGRVLELVKHGQTDDADQLLRNLLNAAANAAGEQD